jgi:hypothetical protein
MSDAAEVMSQESEAPQEGTNSLLSVAQPEAPVAEGEAMPHMANDAPAPTEAEFEWGDRPDWMPENFWSNDEGPDLEALAKSYAELRTKFSQGKHNAPKDGKYDVAQLKDHGISDDDPLLNDFSGFAKENGLSQEQFDQVTKMYMQHMGDMFEKTETNVQQEISKLGKNADRVISNTSQWLQKMETSGVLSSEEADALAAAATSANFVKALNKIRDSYGEKSIPAVEIQEGNAYSRADLDALVADPRYGKDMSYTKQVERKFMEFFGE